MSEALKTGPYVRYRATRRIRMTRAYGVALVIEDGETIEFDGVQVRWPDGRIVECIGLAALIGLGRLLLSPKAPAS